MRECIAHMPPTSEAFQCLGAKGLLEDGVGGSLVKESSKHEM